MKAAIIGAGAIGGFYGAALADAGMDVSFIARGKTLIAIREHGLRRLLTGLGRGARDVPRGSLGTCEPGVRTGEDGAGREVLCRERGRPWR